MTVERYDMCSTLFLHDKGEAAEASVHGAAGGDQLGLQRAPG